MPNERLATEVVVIHQTRTELPASARSNIPLGETLRTRELARDMEPTAEVIGKMPELSFQKHGGPDNSQVRVRL